MNSNVQQKNEYPININNQNNTSSKTEYRIDINNQTHNQNELSKPKLCMIKYRIANERILY
ncbi:hypothetical protein Hanom_Chr14g01265881 [Helianthus anomalus]